MKPQRTAGRAIVDLDGRADLFDQSSIHHHQPICQRHRFKLVMRDIDAGGLQPPLQPAYFNAHLHPQFGIEIGQRLVEQEGGRLANDSAPHGNALALPAGEFARFTIQHRPDFEDLGGLRHTAVDFARSLPPISRPYSRFLRTVICG